MAVGCAEQETVCFLFVDLFLSTPEDCEVWVPFASDGHVRNGILASGRRSRVISWLPARVEILHCFPDGHQILVIGSVIIIGETSAALKCIQDDHARSTPSRHDVGKTVVPEKHSRDTSQRNSSETHPRETFQRHIPEKLSSDTSQRTTPDTHPRETDQRHIPEKLSRDTFRRNSPETPPRETLQRHTLEKLSRDTPLRNSSETHPRETLQRHIPEKLQSHIPEKHSRDTSQTQTHQSAQTRLSLSM